MTSEYDISKKKDDKTLPNKEYKSKVYTGEEINRILQDYIEVPPSKWGLLRYGQKISYYMKEDNFFKFGGYINAVVDNKEETEKYFCLRANMRKTSKSNWTWMVTHSKLAKVFLFVSPEYEFISKRIKENDKKLRKELIETIDTIAEHIKGIKKRVKILEKKVDGLDDTHSVTSTAVPNIRDNASTLGGF